MKREFREEFGVEIEVGPLLCTGEFSSKSDDYTLQVYRIKILGTPECREHVEIGWKSFKEIQELTFAPSDRIIINALGKSV